MKAEIRNNFSASEKPRHGPAGGVSSSGWVFVLLKRLIKCFIKIQ